MSTSHAEDVSGRSSSRCCAPTWTCPSVCRSTSTKLNSRLWSVWRGPVTHRCGRKWRPMRAVCPPANRSRAQCRPTAPAVRFHRVFPVSTHYDVIFVVCPGDDVITAWRAKHSIRYNQLHYCCSMTRTLHFLPLDFLLWNILSLLAFPEDHSHHWLPKRATLRVFARKVRMASSPFDISKLPSQ